MSPYTFVKNELGLFQGIVRFEGDPRVHGLMGRDLNSLKWYGPYWSVKIAESEMLMIVGEEVKRLKEIEAGEIPSDIANRRQGIRKARVQRWVSQIDIIKKMWDGGDFREPVLCYKIGKPTKCISFRPHVLPHEPTVPALLWEAGWVYDDLHFPVIVYVNNKLYLTIVGNNFSIRSSVVRILADSLIEIDFPISQSALELVNKQVAV
jgi:hypothetical protein